MSYHDVNDQVRCGICGELYRAIPSYIKLVCNDCYEERPPDATGLIDEFLEVLKHARAVTYSHQIGTVRIYLKNMIKEWEAKKNE